MTHIKYFGFLFASIVLTIISAIFEAVRNGELLAGSVGFPLDFSNSSLFGGGETNYLNLTLDIIFWLIIIILFKYFLNFLKSVSKK